MAVLCVQVALVLSPSLIVCEENEARLLSNDIQMHLK